MKSKILNAIILLAIVFNFAISTFAANHTNIYTPVNDQDRRQGNRNQEERNNRSDRNNNNQDRSGDENRNNGQDHQNRGNNSQDSDRNKEQHIIIRKEKGK